MNFWKRVKEWFANLRRKESPANPAITTPISIEVSKPSAQEPPNPFAEFRGMRLVEVYYRRSQAGMYAPLTVNEERLAREAGVIFPAAQDIGPAVDNSGFHLGGENGEGQVKVNALENGRSYYFTYYIRPDTTTAEVWVFGVGGTQVLSVNGVSGDASRRHVVHALPGRHEISIAVQSVGGRIGVQLRQS